MRRGLRIYFVKDKFGNGAILRLFLVLLWTSCTGIIFFTGLLSGLSMCERILKKDFESCQYDIDHQRYLFQQLKVIADVLRENASLNGTRALQHVMEKLDPQFATSSQMRLSTSSTPKTANACGEVYKETQPSSFIRDPHCDPNSKPGLDSLVTVILLAPASVSSGSPIDQPLAPLRQLYPLLRSIVATDRTEDVALSSVTEVMKVEPLDFQQTGALWNRMVQKVSSPYVLVARSVLRVDVLARLPRLIFVLSASSVSVVGGSLRDESGRWRMGCIQTQMRHYTLRLQRGYRYSALDCMLCDHLEGPFLTRTDLLRQVSLHKNLPDTVLFEDWFLRLKRRGVVTAACPDSLFFVNSMESKDVKWLENDINESWRQLATHWQLDRVLPADRPALHFSCDDVGLVCDLEVLQDKGLLLPSCCIEKIMETLKVFDAFTARHGLDYEVSEGTLLGAVKLRSILPWEIDGDIWIELSDFFTYISKRHELRKLGYYLSPSESLFDRYFSLSLLTRKNTPDFTIDLWGQVTLSRFMLPEMVKTFPTRVEINGFWLRGTWNPGLAARNRYGPGYLHHAVGWSRQGMKTHMDRYKYGIWGNCTKMYHHSCLNRYSTEGSFEFLDS